MNILKRDLAPVTAAARQALTTTKAPEDIAEKVSLGLTAPRKSSVEGPSPWGRAGDLGGAARPRAGLPPVPIPGDHARRRSHVSRFVDEASLLSTRDGELELALGGDIATGYASHDTEKGLLFFLESFTFQVPTRRWSCAWTGKASPTRGSF